MAKVKLQRKRMESLAFDVSNVNSYLSQISSDIPKFSSSLNQYSDLEKIRAKKQISNEVLLKFSGTFNAIIINSDWRNALKGCTNKNAQLLNFDHPTNRPATIEFMKENNLDRVPVFVVAVPPYILNIHGKLLFETTATKTEADAAIYPTLKPDNTLVIEAAPAGSVKVVCLVEIQPVLRREDKQSYTKTWAKIATEVLGLAGEFKTAYDKFSEKARELPLTNIEGRQRIVASPKFGLIKLAKFLATHQFSQSFDKAKFNDLIDLSGAKSMFKNLIKLLTPKSNHFTLPKEILEIEDKYSDIVVTGKMTESDGSTYYAGTGSEIDLESTTPIIQYRFFPISSNKKVPEKGYLIAIGDAEVTTLENVYFTNTYQPIGGNCSLEDNIQQCNSYIPMSVDQYSVDCAKYVLGLGPDMNCNHVVMPLTFGRADCGEGQKILVGAAVETEVSLNCNGNLLRTQTLRPGVHSIDTECALVHSGTIIVPQLLKMAEVKGDIRITEGATPNEEIEYDILIKYLLPVVGLLTFLILICGASICCFLRPDKCLNFWCRCRNQKDNASSAPDFNDFGSDGHRTPRQGSTNSIKSIGQRTLPRIV